MALAFLASCLVGLGFWQAVAAVANWPGLSFVGARRVLGGCLAALLFGVGATLAILSGAEPVTFLLALPGVVVGLVCAVGFGALAGARSSPLAALVTPKPSELRQTETVSIPVSLPHRHPSATETVIAPTSLVMQRDGVRCGSIDAGRDARNSESAAPPRRRDRVITIYRADERHHVHGRPTTTCRAVARRSRCMPKTCSARPTR